MTDRIDEHGLEVWPAPERNKQPIVEQLQQVLGAGPGRLLEVASGTGQHAVHFVRHLPGWIIQPTEKDPELLHTLARRVAIENDPRLLAPVALDVTAPHWPLIHANAVFCANMIHIAPWSAAEGLFRGAGRLLEAAGLLVTYGPYKIAGQHTAESNERFDRSLQERNPAWGVRDLDEVAQLAGSEGLRERQRIAMPANNFLVVWEKV